VLGSDSQGLGNADQQAEKFPGPERSDVRHAIGDPGVHMVNFEAPVRPQSIEKQCHHYALAVMGWGSVGKDENFDWRRVHEFLVREGVWML
jgi:hypothetical protein